MDKNKCPTKFAVAPMLDWTDRHCRFLYRQLSKKALLYTEMVVADAIIHGDSYRLLDSSEVTQPIALQLGGSCPEKLYQATLIAAKHSYSEINLNVGCPSNRVQSGSFGACLMKQPKLVGECLLAIKNALKDSNSSDTTVSLKCRIGVDEQDIQTALDEVVNAALNNNINVFWIHARKAWLQGLSPKENRTIPPINYGRVYQIKQGNPGCFVGINGEIKTIEECLQHLQKVDAVMLGRAVYHNPLLLTKVDREIYKTDKDEFSMQKFKTNICEYACNHIAKGGKLSDITRHMLGFFFGKRGAKKWRQELTALACNPNASHSNLETILDEFIALNKITN